MKRVLIGLFAGLFLLTNLAGCIRIEWGDPTEATEQTETQAPESSTEKETETEPVTEPETEPETEEEDDDEVLAPLMWRVTDAQGHEMYLFGTIHVGDRRNLRVFRKVTPIIDLCDALAVEFDSRAYEKDEAQMMRDIRQFLYTDGTTVRDHMPAELYDKASAFLREGGYDINVLKYYNLAMWSDVVDSVLLDNYSDFASDYGMDSQFIDYAYQKNMPVLSVESGTFQMNLINSFPDELYIHEIESSIENKDTYNEGISTLYELWLSGDQATFWAYLGDEEYIDEDEYEDEEPDEEEETYSEELIAMYEDYNKAMLDDRNVGMKDKALEYLASGQTVFFAVGAAHMAGSMGVVNLLREAGCTVELFTYIEE